MLKNIFIINLLLFSSLCAYSQTISGGVSYTFAQARTIAFENIDFQISPEIFKDRLKDTTRFKFLKNITVYSNGDYSIRDVKKGCCYYYNHTGKLKIIEIVVEKKFPQKTARYDINGKLDSVSLDVNNNEQFIFDVNKKLYAYWLDENCYNEKGELIDTRN